MQSESAPLRANTASVLTFGIDLRSGPRYPTGIASMTADRRCRTLGIARTDEDLLAAIEASDPRIVAIDAPLALPEGRDCADPTCACAAAGIMRDVDRLAARAGYRPYPTLLPSMVKLTLRGIARRETLEARGYEVVETYPGMVQDVLAYRGKARGWTRYGKV